VITLTVILSDTHQQRNQFIRLVDDVASILEPWLHLQYFFGFSPGDFQVNRACWVYNLHPEDVPEIKKELCEALAGMGCVFQIFTSVPQRDKKDQEV